MHLLRQNTNINLFRKKLKRTFILEVLKQRSTMTMKKLLAWYTYRVAQKSKPL